MNSFELSHPIILIAGQQVATHFEQLLTAVPDLQKLPFTIKTAKTLDEVTSLVDHLRPYVTFVSSDLAPKKELKALFSKIVNICVFPACLVSDSEEERKSLEATVRFSFKQIDLTLIEHYARISYGVRNPPMWQREFIKAGSDAEVETSSYQIEELIENAEHRFYSVLESIGVGVCIFATDGILRYCNSQLAGMLGASAEELIGKQAPEIFFPNDPNEARRYREELVRRYNARRQGIGEVYELRVVTPDGRKRWIKVNATPLRNVEDQVIGTIGGVVDITEEKGLKEQLGWSQKMEAVGRLAGGVAHDFNNLLTAITGYSELIKRDLSPEDPNLRKVDIILQSSAAATVLTKQLLTLSRKEFSQKSVVPAATLLEENLVVLGGLLGENILIETDIAADLPAVEVDKGQFQQILMNLAVNSRDAMPSGGKISISLKSEELSRGLITQRKSLPPGRYLLVSFTDTGEGISDEVKKHLFEPFFTTKRGTGSGLGLSTSYVIVRQHRGEVVVESTVGVGTTFKIYIPASDAEFRVRPDLRVHIGSTRGSEKILVAEDEESVRNLLADILKEAGYEITLARDGAQGLAHYKEQKGEFDLLLSDVVMPKFNGIELAKELRRKDPNLKLVLMSGYSDDTTIPETIERLGAPFLPKPFSPSSLLETVRMVLDAESVELE